MQHFAQIVDVNYKVKSIMRTCPNPKCNATGIPEDAKFCPICGAQIVRKKKDKEQLMKEALSTWDAAPNKPQYKKLKFGIKLVIVTGFVGGIFFALLVSSGGADLAIKTFGFVLGFCVLIIGPVVAIPCYIKDRKAIKAAKKSFVDKYVREHEYE